MNSIGRPLHVTISFISCFLLQVINGVSNYTQLNDELMLFNDGIMFRINNTSQV